MRGRSLRSNECSQEKRRGRRPGSNERTGTRRRCQLSVTLYSEPRPRFDRLMPDPRRGVGRAGEDAAAQYLTTRGLSVVARNVRFRRGEIDLVCRDGPTWVFVEVKGRRADWGDPAAAAVTPLKRRRLMRLAQTYLKWRGLGEPPCRFDVVAVTLDARGATAGIAHLRGAFDVEAW
jgi:putative endonuclease